MIIELPPIPTRPDILAANIATAIMISILLLAFWNWKLDDKEEEPTEKQEQKNKKGKNNGKLNK